MSNRQTPISRALRPHSLAACLAATLGLTLSAATSGAASSSGADGHDGSHARPYPPGPSERFVRARAASNPHTPDAHVVTNCTDDANNPDPNGLRAQIAAAAVSGDNNVDLSTLTCSKITLSAPIQIGQTSLYLHGPSANSGHTVTIDGNAAGPGAYHKIFSHTGIGGILGIYNLTVTNGFTSVGMFRNGGCIYSAGSVHLYESTISNCTLLEATNISVKGGGIYAKDDLVMVASTLTYNAVAPGVKPAYGGGAFAGGTVKAYYSTINANVVGSPYAQALGSAGGIFSTGTATIASSTISGNEADYVGGMWMASGGAIASSTVSGNVATTAAGGLYALGILNVSNSTIAFNEQASAAQAAGGIFFIGALDLESSIVADNVAHHAQDDIEGDNPITGAKNLITATALDVPFDTKTACPRLQSLSNTGGLTNTHVPMAASEAIDNGAAPQGLLLDQRQLSRFQGARPDIGSVERQVGEMDDRISTNGFDGLCDQ